MQGPSLSPSEMSFFNHFTPTVDSIAADLADLYRQIPGVSISARENSIISRLRNIPVQTQDVEDDLRELSQQTLDLIRRQLSAPVADFEGEPIPVLLTTADRSNFRGSLARFNYQPNIMYSLVDPQQAMRAVSVPLAKFLASRSAQTRAASTTSAAPNVTVSNRANGWQIVYSPYYVSSENGFGGPSTPVSGYLSPGRYRFGIKQTSPAQWDSTSWNVPTHNQIFIPLP